VICACENSSPQVKMNDPHISEIIEKELKEEKSFSAEEISFIHKHLITPIKEKYISDSDSTKIFELWTVFEESPGTEKNRIIFYDEEENNFGLGMRANGKCHCRANYGNFVKTLKGM